ncbi:MAG: zinc-ribbon domain-containing protein [Oscillospiraceae bacterium]|nr:zinc-ribbon domain-containing protein [Oscillospiraceae bacterium]
MARFCTECGTAIPEGAGFCIECGAKAPEAETNPAQPAVPASPEPYPAVPQPQPVPEQNGYEEPQQAAYPPRPSAGPSRPDRSGKPVSTLGFWALKLLYAIPVVGFFASLVLSIAPENKSLKHHALATLIWRIIILGFLIFGSIRLWNGIEANWDRVSDSFSEIFEGEEINSLDDLLDSLKNGLAGAGS